MHSQRHQKLSGLYLFSDAAFSLISGSYKCTNSVKCEVATTDEQDFNYSLLLIF